MANFQYSLERTGRMEGGYANHADDAGGETYAGISRVYHPDWIGWKMIDKIPEDSRCDTFIKRLPGIHDAIDAFYRKEFWERMCLDGVAEDFTAWCIYDFAVLFGPTTPALCLQQSLNVFNMKAKLWPDIEADGAMGPKTVMCLNVAIATQSLRKQFLTAYNSLRVSTHVMNTLSREANESQINGWLNRTMKIFEEILK